MTMLGDFWCKDRKPGSGWKCNLGLECPRAYEEYPWIGRSNDQQL